MTRLTLPLILALYAGSTLAAPCTGDPADGSYRCEDHNLLVDSSPFVLPKSGVNHPLVVTEDYRHGVCDLIRIMFRYSEMPIATMPIELNYDDGDLSFDCRQDLEYPR